MNKSESRQQVSKEYSFPNQESPAMMRVEIVDTQEVKAGNEIEAEQLQKRLVTVVNDISSRKFNMKEQQRRIASMQSELDAIFDVKKAQQRLEVNDHMAGPAFKKIMA